MYEQNEMTVAQIAEELGVSRTAIYRALNRHSTPVIAPRRPRSVG